MSFLRGRYLNYARGYYITNFSNLIGVISLVIMHEDLHIVPEITVRVFALCMMSLAICFCLAIIGPNLPEAFNTNNERSEEEQKEHNTAVDLVGFGATCALPAVLVMAITIVMFFRY